MSVDLTLAKAHVRVTASSSDAIIGQYLAAAKAWVESYTHRKLTAETEVTEVFSAFPGTPFAFSLSWGPSPSDVEVAYVDADGADQSITTGQLVDGKLYPPLDAEWPSIEANSVIEVTYKVGYDTVPTELDQAVLLLVGEYFDQRSASEASSAVSAAVESLCEPYRIPVLR